MPASVGDRPVARDSSHHPIDARPPGSERTTARATLVALVPGALFMATFVWRSSSNPDGARRFTLFDDAMISLTYGRTLARHGELVWFDGADRVQGITNPLWTLVMAVVHWLGLDGSRAALAINLLGAALVLLSGLLVSLLVQRSLRDPWGSRWIAFAAGGAIPFVYPLMFWSVRGMEVGLLAVAALVMVWSAPGLGRAQDPDASWSAACAVATVVGVLGRLDFVVVAVAIGAAAALPDGSSRRTRVARFAAVTGPALAAAICILVAQRTYYGDWLPNTYHLKMEGYSPLERVTRGIVSAGKSFALVISVVLGVLAVVRHRRADRAARTVVAGGAAFVATVAYSIWVGGDAWESFLMTSRYVSVSLPLAVVVIAVAVERVVAGDVGSALHRWAAVVVIGAAGAGLVSNPYRFHGRFAIFATAVAAGAMVVVVAAAYGARPRRGEARPTVRHRREWVAAAAVAVTAVGLSGAYPLASWTWTGGLHVRDDQRRTEETIALLGPVDGDAVVATTWAGAPGYYAERPMIDLYGKSDAHIARLPPIGALYPGHNKWDHAHSIGELRPDVVLRVWPADSTDARRIEEWGYVVRCVELPSGRRARANYLTSSDAVDWDRLDVCV